MRCSRPMAGLRDRLHQSGAAFQGVLTHPDLRRLQLAGAATSAGNFGYWVAFVVFTYRAGGAVAVGVVGFIRLAGSALLAPVAGVVADRYPRRAVMLTASLGCAACLAAAAAVDAAGGPTLAVYVFVVAY